jgi:hypothetical protein
VKQYILGVLILISSVGCQYAAPDAGQEAVLVNKPWFAGHGGVIGTSVKTGTELVAASTSITYVNMQPQQVHVHFDDLFTMDGVPLDFEASVQLKVTDAVKLVKDFGADIYADKAPGFFSRNLEQPFRMAVRDAVKKHGLNEMAITVTAAHSVDTEVTEKLTEAIKSTGVPVSLLGVTLGRANPPDAIKHQRIATAEQEQRQQTEKQAKLAEDQRKMHEESRAAADNAYRESMHLSVDQYVQLMHIDMLRSACAKATCTFIQGAGALPTVPVR